MRFSLMPRAVVLWLFPLAIALVSWRFVLGVELTMPVMLHHALARPIAFFLHVGLAPVALAVLPFQLSPGLRRNRPALHRWLGRIYALSILLSGVGGLVIAVKTDTGLLAAWGFGVLAVLWLMTTALAVYYAIQKKFADHRAWILRSAALTFAAVTLRLYLPFGAMIVGFDQAYPYIAWLCWVPNILVAEYFIRRRPQSLLKLFG